MEKIEPKFSIIMACYNNEEYLPTAVASVLRQTYSNWELVVVDDSSTDNSYEVASNYSNDPRIKLYKNKKNCGCGLTKKIAVEHSTGDIIGILDADDALEKDALQIIAESYAVSAGHACIYSTFFVCNEELTPLHIFKRSGEIEDGSSNIFKPKTFPFITFSSKYYKRTYGFDHELKIAEDKDLVYKLEEVSKFLYIDKPLYYCRINKNSTTYGAKSWQAAGYCALAQYKAFLRRRGGNKPNFNTKQIANITLEGSLKFLIVGQGKLFFNLFKKSWDLYPFNISGYFLSLKGIMQEIKHQLWLYKIKLSKRL